MQERSWDGLDKLTDNPTDKVFKDALESMKNQFVALHKPGSIVKLSDGQRYYVGPNGNWIKEK